jgi:hypothetical protein
VEESLNEVRMYVASSQTWVINVDLRLARIAADDLVRVFVVVIVVRPALGECDNRSE